MKQASKEYETDAAQVQTWALHRHSTFFVDGLVEVGHVYGLAGSDGGRHDGGRPAAPRAVVVSVLAHV